ncbi:MAG: glucans biosynthesis glucosyltransferase MdoH, partial [Candidatus Nanoarchaeia archaeon]
MADILWRGGGLTGIEIALLILFVPLFGNICLGFLQATLGFFIMLLRRDPFLISNCLDRKKITPDQISPTAIVAPIYNEDVTRVYEGIRSIYLSLVKTGCIDKFSFFILSDSSDPNKWIEEEVAWVELCKQLNAFGKIFYRKRNIQLNSKSGNISDFCRRWGAKYKHMIILDADSLMEGDTLV